MQLEINFKPLVSVGYLILNVPPDVMLSVNTEIRQILNNNFSNVQYANKALYGVINKEVILSKCFSIVSKFSELVAEEYWQYTPHRLLKNKRHRLISLWANLQKKGEFNPVHNHTDCDLSFVMWVRIPYNLQSEKELPHVVNTNNFQQETTAFTFLFADPYNSHVISKEILQIDSSYEGKMILFPSSLQHMVYPFFASDEYRISVAGNIKLED